MQYFSRTTKGVCDPTKQNAVIMGKNTYYGIPANKRPLPERLNIVLSTKLTSNDLPGDVLLFRNLEAAMEALETKEWRDKIEKVWIVGGSGVYAEAMSSPRCNRLYLTKIQEKFECDTFFPEIPKDFHEVPLDEDIPQGVQEENGTKYEYKILEKQ